jgi:hypothetical protein
MSNRILAALFVSLVSVGAHASTIVDCNSGALRIVTGNDPRFSTATVTGPAADYVIAQAKQTRRVTDTNHQSIDVLAGFPNYVTTSEVAHQIVITNMQFQHVEGGFATGGPVGVQFRPYAHGADLTFVNGKMTSSHSQAVWTTANWWFDNCSYSK